MRNKKSIKFRDVTCHPCTIGVRKSGRTAWSRTIAHLVGSNIKAAIHLHCVGADNLAAKFLKNNNKLTSPLLRKAAVPAPAVCT